MVLLTCKNCNNKTLTCRKTEQLEDGVVRRLYLCPVCHTYQKAYMISEEKWDKIHDILELAQTTLNNAQGYIESMNIKRSKK